MQAQANTLPQSPSRPAASSLRDEQGPMPEQHVESIAPPSSSASADVPSTVSMRPRSRRTLIEDRTTWVNRRRSALQCRLHHDSFSCESRVASTGLSYQPSSQNATSTGKDCKHDWCLLGQRRCCACLDKRPGTSRLAEKSHASFPRYVDGTGFLLIGRQEDGYCHACVKRITELRHETTETQNLNERPHGSTGQDDRPLSGQGNLTTRQALRNQRQISRLSETFGGTPEEIGQSEDYISPLTTLFETLHITNGNSSEASLDNEAFTTSYFRPHFEVLIPTVLRAAMEDLWRLEEAYRKQCELIDKSNAILAKHNLPEQALLDKQDHYRRCESIKKQIGLVHAQLDSDARVDEWMARYLDRFELSQRDQDESSSNEESAFSASIDLSLYSDDRDECRICLVRRMDTILMPCAHIVCCVRCAVQVCEPTRCSGSNDVVESEVENGMAESDRTCPVCRENVICWTKIYRA